MRASSFTYPFGKELVQVAHQIVDKPDGKSGIKSSSIASSNAFGRFMILSKRAGQRRVRPLPRPTAPSFRVLAILFHRIETVKPGGRPFRLASESRWGCGSAWKQEKPDDLRVILVENIADGKKLPSDFDIFS
jgi:hypothetical protein